MQGLHNNYYGTHICKIDKLHKQPMKSIHNIETLRNIKNIIL